MEPFKESSESSLQPEMDESGASVPSRQPSVLSFGEELSTDESVCECSHSNQEPATAASTLDPSPAQTCYLAPTSPGPEDDTLGAEHPDIIVVNDDDYINFCFSLSRELGKGAFATVFLAESRANFELVAVKVIEKSKLPMSQFLQNHLREEMKVLRSLAHPKTIIKVHQVIESPQKLFIITEACLGGDLQTFLEAQPGGYLPEAQARHVMLQVIDAVKYLHARGIVHRDIKSENILLARQNELRIKLTDFSVSKFVGTDAADPKFWMSSFCGTPSWMSPEIFLHVQHNTKGYTYEIDIWSMGVLCYLLLSGHLPFEEGRLDLLLRAKFHFNHKAWRNVSPAAKDFIRQLLIADPEQRLKATAISSHPWLRQEAEAEAPPGLASVPVDYTATLDEDAMEFHPPSKIARIT